MKKLNFQFMFQHDQNSFYHEITLMARFLFKYSFHEKNENPFLYKYEALKIDYFLSLISIKIIFKIKVTYNLFSSLAKPLIIKLEFPKNFSGLQERNEYDLS